MSSSDFSTFTKLYFVFREIYKPALKINEKTAYKLALAGEIPGFKVGGSWRFQRQEIANWIKRKVEEQKGGSGGA